MRHLLTVVISIILSSTYYVELFADVSYADLFLSGRGYKPVEDKWSLGSSGVNLSEGMHASDNYRYREWCINTFNNGEQIYKAYKEIAFDIDYRAEPPKIDYWQTPEETVQSKQGDCEDSVFLFFSQLSEFNIDGDIVWGWVVDKDNSIAFAHVWYQLFDKRGRPYIVEGFSKEWNGIIPAEMMNGKEKRIPTLMLRHNQVNQVADGTIAMFFPNKNQGTPESLGDVHPSWELYFNNVAIIQGIFQKLQDMLHRCR